MYAPLAGQRNEKDENKEIKIKGKDKLSGIIIIITPRAGMHDSDQALNRTFRERMNAQNSGIRKKHKRSGRGEKEQKSEA